MIFFRNMYTEYITHVFIEHMKTENKIEIRNVSMFIIKSFEIRKPFILISIPLTLSLLICNCVYNEGS